MDGTAAEETLQNSLPSPVSTSVADQGLWPVPGSEAMEVNLDGSFETLDVGSFPLDPQLDQSFHPDQTIQNGIVHNASNLDQSLDNAMNYNAFAGQGDNFTFPDSNFDEFNYFELLPGLQASELPNFTFQGSLGDLTAFSPLERNSTSSQSPGRQSQSAINGRGSISQGSQPLGPMPLFAGKKSPVVYENVHRDSQMSDNISPRLPRIVNELPSKQPLLMITESVRANLVKDLASRMGADAAQLHVPTAVSLQKCLRTYVDCCHIHLPMFHLHSFDLEHTPSPFILAMCALGAMYRLERKVAGSLYQIAEEALKATIHSETTKTSDEHALLGWSKPTKTSTATGLNPLWFAQCRLLLTFFAAFSGSPAVIRKAIESMGILANVSIIYNSSNI